MDVVQGSVRNRQVAVSSSGALPVQVREDVRGAADVAVVLLHASTEADAPVLGGLHQDDLVPSTAGVEVLPLTVLSLLTW